MLVIQAVCNYNEPKSNSRSASSQQIFYLSDKDISSGGWSDGLQILTTYVDHWVETNMLYRAQKSLTDEQNVNQNEVTVHPY